jgi:hypothetical protein
VRRVAGRVERAHVEPLLAPERGGAVVVVVRDRHEAGRLVEPPGAGLRRPRVQAHPGVAQRAGGVLEGVQQPPRQAAAAGLRQDVHPLDLPRPVAQALDAAPRDRGPVLLQDEVGAVRRPQLVRRGARGVAQLGGPYSRVISATIASTSRLAGGRSGRSGRTWSTLGRLTRPPCLVNGQSSSSPTASAPPSRPWPRRRPPGGAASSGACGRTCPRRARPSARRSRRRCSRATSTRRRGSAWRRR